MWRFVAEMGGKGNVHAIHSALEAVIREAGYVPLPESNLLYFPTIAQYATVLEAAGLRVTDARHFDRPIRLEGGEDGLRNWMRMFADRFMAVVPDVAREDILGSVETRVRHELHRDGAWHADYRRLRVFAVRM